MPSDEIFALFDTIDSNDEEDIENLRKDSDTKFFESLIENGGSKSDLLLSTRTFKVERITVFIFSFCIGLVTQLNGPALGVLKHYYITKRIREFLIGNSRLLIYNLLNQLVYYTV